MRQKAQEEMSQSDGATGLMRLTDRNRKLISETRYTKHVEWNYGYSQFNVLRRTTTERLTKKKNYAIKID